MATILIIDDDEKMCLLLSKIAGRLGHESRSAYTLGDALTCCNAEDFDLVLLDLELPDGNGLHILPDLIKSSSSPEVIIVTGVGDIEGAELAFKYGAWDFIPKPLRPAQVKLSITRALLYRGEKQAVKKPSRFSREGIIGQSAALKTCLDQAAQAAAAETAILLTGETGSGKELLARAIHNGGARAGGQFVVVDCASLPESLLESALFGHEKGAFTGAASSRPGLIKQAEKGTLFLDEVAELPRSMQKVFLRVLQERSFRPVGADSEVQIDFRLVAATNRDLDAMVKAGDFRKDLMYRIRSITIDLPPLRERRADIRSLVTTHLEKRSASNGSALKGCSPEFMQLLQAHDWPGNVRELLNALDHALAMASNSPTLHPIHLPPRIRLPRLKGQLAPPGPDSRDPSGPLLQQETLPEIREYREKVFEVAEKEYLMELMRRSRGQVKAACAISGLSRSRLHALLKKYDTPRFRKSE